MYQAQNCLKVGLKLNLIYEFGKLARLVLNPPFPLTNIHDYIQTNIDKLIATALS